MLAAERLNLVPFFIASKIRKAHPRETDDNNAFKQQTVLTEIVRALFEKVFSAGVPFETIRALWIGVVGQENLGSPETYKTLKKRPSNANQVDA